MKNPEPEWVQKQMSHNAVTMLTMSLFAQPLFIFALAYWFLDAGTAFSKNAVIGLSILAALVNFLFLYWLIKIVKGKGDQAK